MKFLIDLNTGEPLLDFNGNLVPASLSRSFNQYLDVLFHTPILEEQLIPTWGLDIRSIMQVSSSTMWEEMIKYIFVEALDPKREPLVDSIQEIKISRDGAELSVDIHVLSTFGTNSRNEVLINE